MNAPAKRFSLQRLLTTAPAPMPTPPAAPAPVVAAPIAEIVPPPAPAVVAPALVALPDPPAEALAKAGAVPPRAPKSAEEESHPKKKRSYSVDMKLCEDLEILSWYLGRSSSSVVEDLIRKHLQHNKSVVLKAREIRSAR